VEGKGEVFANGKQIRTLKETVVTYSTTNISQGHVTDVPSCVNESLLLPHSPLFTDMYCYTHNCVTNNAVQ
jgi:hypothetical protein